MCRLFTLFFKFVSATNSLKLSQNQYIRIDSYRDSYNNDFRWTQSEDLNRKLITGATRYNCRSKTISELFVNSLFSRDVFKRSSVTGEKSNCKKSENAPEKSGLDTLKLSNNPYFFTVSLSNFEHFIKRLNERENSGQPFIRYRSINKLIAKKWSNSQNERSLAKNSWRSLLYYKSRNLNVLNVKVNPLEIGTSCGSKN